MAVTAGILSPFHVEVRDRVYLTALTCTYLSCRGLSPGVNFGSVVVRAELLCLFDVLPFVRAEETRLFTSKLAFNKRRQLNT